MSIVCSQSREAKTEHGWGGKGARETHTHTHTKIEWKGAEEGSSGHMGTERALWKVLPLQEGGRDAHCPCPTASKTESESEPRERVD